MRDEFDDLLNEEPPAPTPPAKQTPPPAKPATKPAEASAAPAPAAKKETAKVATKKTAAQTKAAKAKASKATASKKASASKKAAKPKVEYVRENGVIPASKRNLKIGTVLVYEGKFGKHSLKVIAPNKAQTEKGYKFVYKLDGKTVFTSPTLASNHVMKVEHSNGWAFWKLPA